ncbi:MAG: cation diffusion facilitator family transporter [Chitinophagales bacterium]
MPIRIQRYIALLSVVLFLAKMLAWYLTNSVTVLTDALESIVNMAAGFLGLFSIALAALPRDTNHPYGHGKAEFLSSAVEGTLIIIAGVVIIYEAINHLIIPHKLEKLDTGLLIIAAAGGINFIAGKYAEKKGKKSNSMILVSAGKHLQTDAYSTIAVIIGLLLLVVTRNKWLWLDSAVALCFAVITMITGYKVLRRSISGIMDEMDLVLLKEVIALLQDKRLPQWVDLHNLRVIQYGSMMHVDAHMTLPWYYQVADADKEIHALENLIKAHFKNQVELFIHIDGCKPYQCKLCALEVCPERQEAFRQQLQWTIDNVWADSKHGKSPTDYTNS